MTMDNRFGTVPRNAMVLAAGKGLRMRPITDRMPKPLVEVAGKALIDHALDNLQAAGVAEVVVNVHHFAEQMENHLVNRTAPKIEISDERLRLLDSGGGVVKAAPRLGSQPFFVLNADSFWLDGICPALKALAAGWRDQTMDILLLVAHSAAAVGYCGRGDFTMDGIGRLVRRREGEVAPFVYAGAAIIAPAVLKNAPSEPFSLNLLFDRAIADERLFGVKLDGLWMHVGTPEAIAEAENAVAAANR